jgi:hypothetical protein
MVDDRNDHFQLSNEVKIKFNDIPRRIPDLELEDCQDENGGQEDEDMSENDGFDALLVDVL